jgi:Mitochondrial ATPase expression
MRGSVPSLGAFSNLPQQSSSRIPHLKLHIVARQSRPKSALHEQRANPLQRRCIHAAAPSYSLFGNLFRTSETTQQSRRSKFSASSTHSEARDLELHDSIDQILYQAHPERVLYALLSTNQGRGFVARADSTTFGDAFRSIDPCYLVEPFKDVYRYIKPSLTTQPKYRWVRAIEDRLELFAQQLNEIVNLRRSAGHQLTKDVCSHLLHCARVLGHGPMARQVLHKMIPEDGVQNDLDVHAYNCYMEATCWSNAFSKTEQWRLRITPRMLALRRTENPPPDLSGHRVGRLGLRHETLVTFRRMVGQKLDGNEETFTNLMVAMGREGDLAGAKSILKSVYNIDVDLLLEVDEEEVETPTFYEPDSPLRPTARLLYTIAHVFGSNNDIGLALKLVDFVSRQYDLRIPFNVWMHLFDWAGVLSLRRSGAQKKQGQATGQVPHSTVDQIWTEMTDQPHNIQPDIVMHTSRARSLRDRGLLRESLKSIQSANTLFEKSRGKAEQLGKKLLALTDEILKHRSMNSFQVVPAAWFNLRRQFILSSLMEDRDLQLLITTIRTTFAERKWPEHGQYKHWERRGLPDLMAYFTEYLPNTLAYRVRGGLMEVTGLKSDRISVAQSKMQMTMWNGLLRSNMDREIATTEDLGVARHRFRADVEEYEKLASLHARSDPPSG